MKTFTLTSLLFLVFITLSAQITISQVNQWTWISGDVTPENKGIYGTQGTPSTLNKPGGRYNSARWTDASGNLWLFGGNGWAESGVGNLNDLWKYNTTTNEWTWMKGDKTTYAESVYGVKGTASSLSKPGARIASFTWTDKLGNLWLFGGDASLTYGLNDLWKYNISTNQWTWVNGDTTTNSRGIRGTKGISSSLGRPGARESGVSWTDNSNNLWLYGGTGLVGSGGFDVVNDLWKYNTLTNEWTWVGGDSTSNTLPYYGSKGIESTSNTPGARVASICWTDESGNFWFFGGGNNITTRKSFNDVWKYNISNNAWTWISGDSVANTSAIYGTQGQPSVTNKPSAGVGGGGFKDVGGNIWLLGGTEVVNGLVRYFNSLWRYNMNTNEWTWLKGDQGSNTNSGIYGVKGTSSMSNLPGGRSSTSLWIDASGNLWVFGGQGNSALGSGRLNDLWKYETGTNLPVTLVSFTGILQTNKISLEWTTQNEENFDRYEIERSFNGSDYIKLYVVKAINVGHYSYNDFADGLRGRKVFYRLRLVDKDGRFNYSRIVISQIPFNAKFMVYPNPASTSFQLQLDKNIIGRAIVEIVDVSGKLVDRKVFDVNSTVITMSVNKLLAGTYSVKLMYKDEEYFQKVVVIK